MKAAPELQLRLLDLQAVDLTLDQLAHRRRTLPEHATIEKLSGALDELKTAVTKAASGTEDLDRRIRRIENDVDEVRGRAAKDTARMNSGAITSSKELERMQAEVASLGVRQSELEDAELELMELRETAAGEQTVATARYDETAAALAAAELARDAAYGEIDALAADETAARGPLATGLPADLIALYEKIRASSGGIGAAALRARRCGGCRLELSGTDLVAVRAAEPDEVLRCEECRRILVRTPESGL